MVFEETKKSARVKPLLNRHQFTFVTHSYHEVVSIDRTQTSTSRKLWKMIPLRYQPGLKKANFRNFWFRDVQIKLFKNFHLKKIPQKNILSVQSYWTLKFKRFGDLSFLSRKRWSCGEFTYLVPLGCSSGRTKPARRTKLILHFRRRKAGR